MNFLFSILHLRKSQLFQLVEYCIRGIFPNQNQHQNPPPSSPPPPFPLLPLLPLFPFFLGGGGREGGGGGEATTTTAPPEGGGDEVPPPLRILQKLFSLSLSSLCVIYTRGFSQSTAQNYKTYEKCSQKFHCGILQ